MPARHAGLIYPYDKDDKRNEENLIISNSKMLYGYGGTVATYGVPIPVKSTYKEFSDLMHQIEINIKNHLQNTSSF